MEGYKGKIEESVLPFESLEQDLEWKETIASYNPMGGFRVQCKIKLAHILSLCDNFQMPPPPPPFWKNLSLED